MGSWVNNMMSGEGRYEWPDGRTYEGNFKADLRHGYGVFNWPGVRKYEG